MADVRAAWEETGDKLTELGRKLKVHYSDQHSSADQQSRQELMDAARRLGSAVQDAFEAIGTAARDKAVQDDVKHVGQSLAEALGATLGQAADELRRAFSERKGPAAAPPSSDLSGGTTEAQAGVEEPAAGAAPAPGTTEGQAGVGPSAGTPTNDKDEPPKVEPWGTP